MNYESPLKVICTELATQITNQMDENVWRAIQRVGIDVDKDELIRALQYDRDQYQKGYNDGYEDGLNADKWISVEDRLPEDGKFVLVCNDDGHMMVAQYIGEDPIWEWQYKYTNYDVDAWDDEEQGPVCWWMPLPEPPKEG